MTASKGEIVEMQITSGRWSLGVVSKIISGDTVNLCVLTDGVNPWPTIDTPNGLIAASYTSVVKGTGVGEWRELALPSSTTAAIAAAVAAALEDYATEDDIEIAIASALSTVATNLASAVSTLNASITEVADDVTELSSSLATLAGAAVTTSAMNTAIAGAIAAIPADDDSGRMVVSPAGSDHAGLGFGTARRPSTTRPTKVTATGTMTLASTLLGAQTASVTLLSDSGTTPTTPRGNQSTALSGVVATVTVPWTLHYEVPAGHYYLLDDAASANASCAITYINETEG